jgi:hypothetical protein
VKGSHKNEWYWKAFENHSPKLKLLLLASCSMMVIRLLVGH